MATFNWLGTNGDYNISGNWSPTGVPGSSDDAIIAAGAVTDALYVVLGTSLTATGSLTLTGSTTTLTGSEGVNVGNSGAGSLLISNGAVFSNTGYNSAGGSSGIYATIGSNAGSVGEVLVTGAGSQWNSSSNSLVVGNTGNGTLVVASSGEVSSTYSMAVGQLSGSSGLLTLQTGGTASFATTLVVGNQAGSSGTINVYAGSQLISTGVPSALNSYVELGENANATGTLNVSGAGAEANLNGNGLFVGYLGDGTLNITNGGEVLTGTGNSSQIAALAIATRGGSEGTVVVDGSGSTLTSVGFGYIGRGGSGKLTVSDSAVVTVGDGADRFDIGGGGASSGTTQTGGDGDLRVTSNGVFDAVENLIVGNNGDTGEVEIDDGGAVEAGGQIGIAEGSATYGSGSGTVIVGPGGSLKAGLTAGDVPSGKAAIYVGDYGTGVGTLTVEGTNALVDAGGYRISIGSGSSSTSGSTGYMTVSQGATARSGSTGTTYAALQVGSGAPSEGTLTIADAGSTFTAAGEAIVGVNGKGHVLIESGGALTTGSTSSSASSGFIIADIAGSEGDVTVTDTGSKLTNTGSFIVGDAAVGSMLIENGAAVTTSGSTGDGADIALAAGSGGSHVNVTGTGSTWSVSGSLEIGVGDTGSLTIADGGQVTADNVDVGAASGQTGNLILTASDAPTSNAATTILTVNNNLNVGTTGYGNLFLGANTAIAVTNDFNVGVDGTVSGSGLIDPAVTTISGSYTATGTLDSKQVIVTSTGTIAPTGGTLTITGTVDGTGAINIGSGDGLVLDGATNAQAGDALTLTFTGANATLDVKDASAFDITVNGYVSTDTVAVYGISGQPAPTYTYQNNDTILTYQNGTTLTFAGMQAAGSVAVTNDPNPACYLRGTRILTSRGEVAIEDLRVGDLVATYAGHGAPLKPVRWLGHRRLDLRHQTQPENTHPIRFRAGALSDGIPYRDLVVSPGHRMQVDGELVMALELVNGASIVQESPAAVEYWHIELDGHDLVLAEGAQAETYQDTGNRTAFENAAVVALNPALDGDVPEPCLPYAGASAAARAHLIARAEALGWTRTVDPAAWLEVDGRRVEPIRRGERYRFAVPPGSTEVRLRSRAGRPWDVNPNAGDRRRLGLKLHRLALGGVDGVREVALDAPELTEGFNPVERDDADWMWRWTNGATPLPFADLAPGRAITVVEIAFDQALPLWVAPDLRCAADTPVLTRFAYGA